MTTSTTPASDRPHAPTRDLIQRFFDHLNDADWPAARALLAEDCVFQAAPPAPDGATHSGGDAVIAALAALCEAWPGAHYDLEELIATDDASAGGACTARWTRRWTAADGQSQHVRGVDIFHLRDGRITQKLAYVKV